MSDSFQQFGRRVISGEARGVRAGLLRLGLSALSPIYSLAMRGRNLKFDRGLGVRRLGRPVVSVGNITTGGTGKTPVVRWLCERLRAAGERPAVLLRGYHAPAGERGDEQAMLEGLLNRENLPPVVVHAEVDRHAGGVAVLRSAPGVSVFVMDDGFQHRRLARDFDLVLIDACEPLGFGRVLPRGLLREPAGGLIRADAILITRADQAADIERVVAMVRKYNQPAPIFRCSHVHPGFLTSDGASRGVQELAGKRFFAFGGIGNPQGFAMQLKGMPGQFAGARWFGDHWQYSRRDLEELAEEAQRAGAEVIITTEKDWVKVAPLRVDWAGVPIWRIELAIRFEGEDETKLYEMIKTSLRQGPV